MYNRQGFHSRKSRLMKIYWKDYISRPLHSEYVTGNTSRKCSRFKRMARLWESIVFIKISFRYSMFPVTEYSGSGFNNGIAFPNYYQMESFISQFKLNWCLNRMNIKSCGVSVRILLQLFWTTREHPTN